MPDRYAGSRARLQRAARVLTGGVSSPFRAKAPVPLFFQDAAGPRLWDVDGNGYIDYALGWGPLILGHKHPELVETLRLQAARPHHYGAQHELEMEVAERLHALVPCAELCAFCCSGSEAVAAVFRLARAFTGRNRILRFEGHYHGWHDQELISYRPSPERMGPDHAPCPTLDSKGQPPNSLENVVVAPWNDLPALEDLFSRWGEEIAAVITEPVLCNSGCLEPEPGFLAELRSLTRRYGSLLIFDEVITGFRIALGGAQQHFGVTPDLATFGKAIAGGVVLSAFAGRKDVMEMMLSGAAFGGTFNGNPLAMAAAKTTLDLLAAGHGAALDHANRMGNLLRQGLEQAAEQAGIALRTTGFGAAFALHFTTHRPLRQYRDLRYDNKELLQHFLRGMLDEGVYLLPDGRVYTSVVHHQDEIAETIGAARKVLNQLPRMARC
ncbi:MAG: aspartate aminotransferase family protein [Bryobacteraceae bacterium]|nr:aspartate aminotransferase family protein [Bryobacteraceae bacterium]MDW8378014.1 aspartate aminotransferase family protein [Bryobacterales bacterium]